MSRVRRSVFALIFVLVLAFAAPSAAAPLDDYKNNGSIPQCKYSDKQVGGELGDLPPDIEQYAPGYADELRNARGGGCGSGGGAGSGANGTTGTAQDRQEDVAAPGSAGGNSGSGGSGASEQVKVNPPPAPVAEKRTKLANVTSPAVNTTPDGPDVPLWALLLMAVALLIGATVGALYLVGADFSRVTRPLGASASETRARTSDRAIELWETVRFGR